MIMIIYLLTDRFILTVILEYINNSITQQIKNDEFLYKLKK